jgi:hypothetical protein
MKFIYKISQVVIVVGPNFKLCLSSSYVISNFLVICKKIAKNGDSFFVFVIVVGS